MDKLPYRVCEGANLSLYPRGTKVGDTVMLTDAQALYERDMGRLEPVVAKPAADAPAAEALAPPVPEGEAGPVADQAEAPAAPKAGKAR